MKRVLGILIVILGAGALTVFATGASNGGDSSPKYWVELDDAFGLISGGDVKVAGVRAGKIGQMKVDERTHRALVEIQINKTGFGSIRTDVTCQARPQSLIGEYFIDCQPGTSSTELKPGSTIPVSRTSSVVAPDLVNDVLRLPYRQRFSIIVSSLGAAVAGNAQNLNDALRRASPALQETDKVLGILAEQNHVIANLVKNADTVVGDLSDNRKEVARWVQMADRTSSASALRRTDIAAGFHKLPGFLEQLRPAMKQLGNVADEQTPALRTLSSAAPQLKTFFDQLGPFATVSRPAIKALGKAGETGRKAAASARPTVALLDQFAKGTPELGGNLATILEHLDNRDFAAEPDPRSPGGKGYTGLEALLEYVYDQVLSVNVYDSSVHILKVAPFVGPCGNYADIKSATTKQKDGTELRKNCAATLGPNQPGYDGFPDTTRPDGAGDARAAGNELRRHRPAEGNGSGGDTSSSSNSSASKPAAPTLSDVIPGAPDVVLPTTPPGQQTRSADLGAATPDMGHQQKLLDYLLKP